MTDQQTEGLTLEVMADRMMGRILARTGFVTSAWAEGVVAYALTGLPPGPARDAALADILARLAPGAAPGGEGVPLGLKLVDTVLDKGVFWNKGVADKWLPEGTQIFARLASPSPARSNRLEKQARNLMRLSEEIGDNEARADLGYSTLYNTTEADRDAAIAALLDAARSDRAADTQGDGFFDAARTALSALSPFADRAAVPGTDIVSGSASATFDLSDCRAALAARQSLDAALASAPTPAPEGGDLRTYISDALAHAKARHKAFKGSPAYIGTAEYWRGYTNAAEEFIAKIDAQPAPATVTDVEALRVAAEEEQ